MTGRPSSSWSDEYQPTDPALSTLVLTQALSYFDVLEMLGDAAWELVTASIQPASFYLVLKRERTTR